MAKSIYMVYLCDSLGCVPRGSILKINIALQSFFEKIVANPGTGFQSALVHWVAYQPTPEPHELLLYFVPDRGLSVVKEAGGPNGSSGDGFTWWRDTTGAVSEVYTSIQSDPDMLSLVGFHELMHNKLRLGNSLLHPKGGLTADPDHVIFMIPHELNDLWLAHVTVMTQLLFASVHETLFELLGDANYLGGQAGDYRRSRAR